MAKQGAFYPKLRCFADKIFSPPVRCSVLPGAIMSSTLRRFSRIDRSSGKTVLTAGLPRNGGSALGEILKQNETIHVTPALPLSKIIGVSLKHEPAGCVPSSPKSPSHPLHGLPLMSGLLR